jgi:hypothetical protein
MARDTEQLDSAAARVAEVPMVVGAWHAQEETADPAAFERAGAKTHWTRLYVHQRTKESVLVILMCGRPGKMAVHTPEVCYSGAGYELHSQVGACAIKSEGNEETAQFWTARFTKKTGTTSDLRLYWTWNAHGAWEASPSPRWQFRGAPFLYKLYVSRNLGDQPNLAPQTGATAMFLREFVPVLNHTLFPPEHPG